LVHSFFVQAEDGIRDRNVTGVQTCALPILSEVSIKGVIDHHRIANFETSDPLYYRAEPVGCTATILLKIFKEYEVAIPNHIAGLMLSAIVSDTLLLKSPTCTSEDVRAAEE